MALRNTMMDRSHDETKKGAVRKVEIPKNLIIKNVDISRF
jgi:hypothetical protein